MVFINNFKIVTCCTFHKSWLLLGKILSPQSLKPNISISKSKDTLTLKKHKERKAHLLGTFDTYIISIQEVITLSEQVICAHIL